MISIEVTGGPQIAAKLAEIEKRARNKAAADAVRAGGKVFVAAMQAAVPVDTGTSKKAIGMRTRSYKGGRIKMAVVGFRKGQGRNVTRTVSKRGKIRVKAKRLGKGGARAKEFRDPYYSGHLSFTGRKAVRAKGKRLPVDLPSGQIVFARSAAAVPPNPWMRRAYEQAKANAQGVMINAMRTAIGLGG